MAKPALSSQLSPDGLRRLAETRTAEAMRIEAGPEQLTALTIAEALMNLAEIKERLLKYQRRLMN